MARANLEGHRNLCPDGLKSLRLPYRRGDRQLPWPICPFFSLRDIVVDPVVSQHALPYGLETQRKDIFS